MGRDAQWPGTAAGFALAETLVALLLLALALTGAATALAAALAAQHGALLQARAADLASDLAEALRPGLSADEAAAEILAWQQQSLRVLPQAATQATASGATLAVQMQWAEPRTHRAAQLHLPIAMPTGSP